MYCVVCLKNRAREFFCPYCKPNIEVILTPKQLTVNQDTFEDFKSLPIDRQWEVIYLTNKRLGRMLKAHLSSEFFLDRIILEYTEMVLGRHEHLEFPPLPNDFNMNLTSYNQYKNKKEFAL